MRILKMRTLVAFLIAPLFPGVMFLLFFLISSEADAGVWFFCGSTFVAYLVTIVFGVPTYMWLRKCNNNDLWGYLICGSLLSIVPIAQVISLPGSFSHVDLEFLMQNLGWALLIILLSTGTAFIFWIIARPDLNVDKIQLRNTMVA